MLAAMVRGRAGSLRKSARPYCLYLKRKFWRIRLSARQTALLRPANRTDVVECYRAILGREPESRTRVSGHLRGGPLLKEVVSHFARSGELREQVLRSNIAFDYASRPSYLAKSIHGVRSVQAYFGHYGFLTEAFTPSALHMLIAGHAELYIRRGLRAEYRIVITATHYRHEEGELQLQLHRDDALLYVLGVTIVPGEVLGMRERQVLLISRMQGVPGLYFQIREAAKEFGDIHPKAILFAVLQGVAKALEIAVIVGVSAKNQLAFRDNKAGSAVNNYDEFFISAGAEEVSGKYFVLDSNGERKVSRLADRSHFKRAERKRLLKAEMSRAAATEVQNWLRQRGADDRCAQCGAPDSRRVVPAELASKKDTEFLSFAE